MITMMVQSHDNVFLIGGVIARLCRLFRRSQER